MLESIKHIYFNNLTIYRSGYKRFADVINLYGTDSIYFSNCHFYTRQVFDFNDPANVFLASTIYGNIFLEECKFSYGSTSFHFQNLFGARNIKINNCVFENFRDYGINLSGADSFQIENNSFRSTPGNTAQSAIKLFNCGGNIKITANKIRETFKSAYNFNRIGAADQEVLIANNVINNNLNYGIYISASKNLNIVHNSIYSYIPLHLASSNSNIFLANNYLSSYAGEEPISGKISGVLKSDFNYLYAPQFDLQNWQKKYFIDSNSISFSSTRLIADSVYDNDARLKWAANKLEYISTDVNNLKRDSLHADIGAYEIQTVFNDLSLFTPQDFISQLCKSHSTTINIYLINRGFLTKQNIDVTLKYIQGNDSFTHICKSQKMLKVYDTDKIVIDTFLNLKKGDFKILAYVNEGNDENLNNDTIEINGRILAEPGKEIHIENDTLICNTKEKIITAPHEKVFWYRPGNQYLLRGQKIFLRINTSVPDTYLYSTYSSVDTAIEFENSQSGVKLNNGFIFITVFRKLIIESITVTPLTTGYVDLHFNNRVKRFIFTTEDLNKPKKIELYILTEQSGQIWYTGSAILDSRAKMNLPHGIDPYFSFTYNNISNNDTFSFINNITFNIIACESEPDTFIVKGNFIEPEIILNKGLSGLDFGGYEINPDKICAGNNMYYEVKMSQPKDSFNKTWEINSWKILPEGYFSTVDANLQKGGGNFWPGIQIAAKSKHIGRPYKIEITVKDKITGCDSTVSRWFKVWPASSSIQQDIFGDDTICLTQKAIFSIPLYWKDSVKMVDWNLGDGTKFSNISKVSHIYKDTGTYTIIVTLRANSGCNYYYRKTVKIQPVPQTSFQYLNKEKYIFSLVPTDLKDGNNYKWLVNGIEISQQAKPELELIPGVHKIELYIVNKEGCGNYFKQNITIWEVDTTTYIEPPKNAIENYILFPNPSNGILNFTFNLKHYYRDITVKIIGADGKIIKTRYLGDLNKGEHNCIINLENAGLEQGTYFIILNSNLYPLITDKFIYVGH